MSIALLVVYLFSATLHFDLPIPSYPSKEGGSWDPNGQKVPPPPTVTGESGWRPNQLAD